MNEQVDFTSDVCIHTECDCNCMTAKEKRIQNIFNTELNALRAQLDAAKATVRGKFFGDLKPGDLLYQKSGESLLEFILLRREKYDHIKSLESSLERVREALSKKRRSNT